MIKSIGVVCITLCMLASLLIADTTYVSGTINTNTIWNPAGSPYIIIGNVEVNTGVRLEIISGVKVLFTADKYMMVKGTLKAIGSELDSITFTALDTTQMWQRLWIKPEAQSCSLKYCRISYANKSAIYNEASLYISYSRLTNNYTEYWGAGICNFGNATITNNTIDNNYASNDGGGIGNFGTATIIKNTISHNICEAYGGGIYNSGNATIMDNTIFINYAFNDGGGVCSDGHSIVINNLIANNSAEYYGGGICNYDSSTINNNIITNNNAYEYGGGIYNEGTVMLNGNTITNNYAENYGGGICNFYGSATIINNTISNNLAYYGGGIHNARRAIIANNTITNNYAEYGGSIYNNDFGTAAIANNTISDITNSTIRVQHGTIVLNYNNLNNPGPNGYTIYNNTGDTINARYNYWFTVDTNLIAQKIYDFCDDSTKGEVYYRPFLNTPLGIDKEYITLEASRPMLKIFPNPAKSYFTVRLPQILNQVQNDIVLKIYDVSGKQIKEERCNGSKVQRITLDGIKNGVYFVHLDNNIPINEKLIIVK